MENKKVIKKKRRHSRAQLNYRRKQALQSSPYGSTAQFFKEIPPWNLITGFVLLLLETYKLRYRTNLTTRHNIDLSIFAQFFLTYELSHQVTFNEKFFMLASLLNHLSPKKEENNAKQVMV